MRVRICYSKLEPMRYIGHLDLHRTWERTFRRAGLPLAYSQGFHPQPRINLASALPLGFTSEAEMADFWLEEELALEDVRQKLEPALPPGLRLDSLEAADGHAPALQTQLLAAEFVATILDPCPDLDEKVKSLLEAGSLSRERRGKTYDLRPLIENLAVVSKDEQNRLRLQMRLAAREGATGRPEEVLDALEIAPSAARVHRTRLIFAAA